MCSARALVLLQGKKEAPRSDGDTGGVSAVGTPMLKSELGSDLRRERQSFGKERFFVPGMEEKSSIYRRLPRAWVLGATRSGRPPRAPGG